MESVTWRVMVLEVLVLLISRTEPVSSVEEEATAVISMETTCSPLVTMATVKPGFRL